VNGRDRDRVQRLLGWADTLAALTACGRGRLETDGTHHLAVERPLEMIGESVTKFSGEFRAAHPHLDYETLREVRNAVAHDYEDDDQPDYDEQWHAMTVDIPAFAAELRRIPDIPERL